MQVVIKAHMCCVGDCVGPWKWISDKEKMLERGK